MLRTQRVAVGVGTVGVAVGGIGVLVGIQGVTVGRSVAFAAAIRKLPALAGARAAGVQVGGFGLAASAAAVGTIVGSSARGSRAGTSIAVDAAQPAPTRSMNRRNEDQIRYINAIIT